MPKIDLNGRWLVRTDPEENGLAENWAVAPIRAEYEVAVPGCIQQLDELAEMYPPHNDMRNGYNGMFFMERTVELPQLTAQVHCRLILGGVGPSAHIWVNGQYIGKSIFAVCRYVADITGRVTAGVNRVTVAITEQYATLITGMRFAGMDWSGIYGDSCIEIGSAAHFSDGYLACRGGKVFAEGTVHNVGPACDGVLTVRVGGQERRTRLSVDAGGATDFSVEIPAEGLPRWSYRARELFTVEQTFAAADGSVAEEAYRTGLRRIETAGGRILVDGQPTFFKGTGSEYYSPTIAPLSDRSILRARYSALKRYGFNFYRCHTHVPTEAEMDVADEMGIMLDVEFGLVSNFNKTTPIELGMEMWRRFIRQSRRHPSVVMYCIGNEGSQLMVDSRIECNRARMAYRIIKENTDDQLGLIAFGMQGELPELPNDVETPHLWSENFLWAYDGLTDIPWAAIGQTTGGKACIVHEYGKFGVWPSLEEERDTTVPGGIKPDHATQSHRFLVENGMAADEPQLIENSRRASNLFTRIILEEARRQPYVSGYAHWTFFRRCGANAGLSDDLGIHTNGEEQSFAAGCNAEIALLMDRGFHNRAFPCGVEQRIRITVSNFSTAIADGELCAVLLDGDETIAEVRRHSRTAPGETFEQVELCFAVPSAHAGKKLWLQARLIQDGRVLAENRWPLWAFDTAAEDTEIDLYVEDITLFRAIKRVFPCAQRLSSVDSAVIGCRSWRDPQLVKTAAAREKILLIADRYDDTVAACIRNGSRVLLVDGGALPEDWMLPPICRELGDRDTGRFYTSFRAGWDKGDLVTLIKPDPLLGDFPHEGFCDLHFYGLIQSARILEPQKIRALFGEKVAPVVCSVSKLPPIAETESVVQDPNAIKEQTGSVKTRFNARLQGYLLRVGDRTAVCTLKLTDDPAGIGMLKQLVRHMMEG